MTQQWSRLGIIHRPDTTREWAANGFCHVPTPLVMGDVVRVFYASLDANNRGSIGYCDLDGSDLTKVKYVSPDPVMRPGPLGAFDCDGVVPSWTDGKRMYYIGFQRCQGVPYMLNIGIIQGDFNHWNRDSAEPLMHRRDEPLSCGAPFVVHNMMWYWSCTHWSDNHYNNVIKRAYLNQQHSAWIPDFICMAPFPQRLEYALGRPWVIGEDHKLKMWYSIRSLSEPSYRMGYAESQEGRVWESNDSEVISLMPKDGGNAEYAAIVDSGGKRWCVFNGAHNGRDGIELAVLEHE